MKTSKPQGAFTLPETGFLKLPQVLQLIPISKTALYSGIKKGIYPAQVKLGVRSSAWRCEDIRDLIQKLGEA